MTHDTRYVYTREGTYIAYQAVGTGPVDVAVDLYAYAGNCLQPLRSRCLNEQPALERA